MHGLFCSLTYDDSLMGWRCLLTTKRQQSLQHRQRQSVVALRERHEVTTEVSLIESGLPMLAVEAQPQQQQEKVCFNRRQDDTH